MKFVPLPKKYSGIKFSQLKEGATFRLYNPDDESLFGKLSFGSCHQNAIWLTTSSNGRELYLCSISNDTIVYPTNVELREI